MLRHDNNKPKVDNGGNRSANLNAPSLYYSRRVKDRQSYARLIKFKWLAAYEASYAYVRRDPSQFFHRYIKSLHTIARCIARVVLQIDGASSGRRKFPRRYFLPILSDARFIFTSFPNFSRRTGRERAANFISARYIFSERSSLGLSGFKESFQIDI